MSCSKSTQSSDSPSIHNVKLSALASEYYEFDLEVGQPGEIAITSSLELVSLRELFVVDGDKMYILFLF